MRKKFLIIIPARSGSSGVKNKNLKLINKKPLLYYTCSFAKKLKDKDSRIIGCTDAANIRKFFLKYRIPVPFLRPKKISCNFSLDIEYVNYCLNYYKSKNIFFSAGVILRPTSPIRSVQIYIKALKKFIKDKSATSLRSVCESPITPYKMWFKKDNEITPLLKSKFKEHYNMPRQKLPKTYWQTGTYEFFRINYKSKIQSISGKKIIFYEISAHDSIDLDTLKDYQKLKNFNLKKF